MRKLIILILTIIPIIGFSQSTDFIIRGKLENIDRPAKVYLLNIETGSLDSTILKDGVYRFKGKISKPTVANLFLDKENKGYKNSRDQIKIFLEPGIITVESPKELIRLSIIGGTNNNNAQQTFKELTRVLDPINARANAKRKAASLEQQQTEAFIAEMSVIETEIISALTKEYISFIKTHPNAIPSANAILDISDFKEYSTIDSLYQSLTLSVKNDTMGKILSKKLPILKNVSLSSVAPDLLSVDTLGNTFKLSSLRGKYVLVDVWASWCGPCRKENPNQVNTYNKFKNQNFTVVGVSLDDDRKNWVNAIRKDKLPWINVSDLKGWNAKVVELYGLNSLPQNYLLNPEGVIIAKNLQGINLTNKLAEIFGTEQ